jgi:hypothetical protein
MTQVNSKHITAPEWSYLSEEARSLVRKYRDEYGVADLDLAVELAVLALGDERAYELE